MPELETGRVDSTQERVGYWASQTDSLCSIALVLEHPKNTHTYEKCTHNENQSYLYSHRTASMQKCI